MTPTPQTPDFFQISENLRLAARSKEFVTGHIDVLFQLFKDDPSSDYKRKELEGYLGAYQRQCEAHLEAVAAYERAIGPRPALNWLSQPIPTN